VTAPLASFREPLTGIAHDLELAAVTLRTAASMITDGSITRAELRGTLTDVLDGDNGLVDATNRIQHERAHAFRLKGDAA
jgi:hypothetical protein